VAEAYVAQREQAEYPWLMKEKEANVVEAAVEPKEIAAAKAPFLLEIGTEELPTGELANALSQLEKAVPALLDSLRLEHGAIEILGTPRRLVVSVNDLATRQPDQNLEVKGPPADRAFDADGNPTRAAEGFARSKGIDVSNLVVETVDGGEYVVARVEQLGQPAMDVLRAALADLVAGLKFSKSMRWNESGVTFSRPIRWLMALLDGEVVPFDYAGYRSGRETRGLRFVEPEHFDVASPQAYFEKMAAQGIILDAEVRKATILEQANAIAEKVGGKVPEDAALLEEVTGLVEAPTAFLGKFDASYLEVLPPEVLISVMRKHQRYFVVEDAQGKLMPYFIGVRNGNADHLDIVADGNEQVILARFADARFFVEKDLKKPLAEFVPELKTLTFQRQLGSFYDKTERISALVEALMSDFNLTDEEKTTAQRAAKLCKADLATNMVVEMTSLQGIMGRYYALHSGETQAVADAIFDHYLPRSADDKLPEAKPGLLIGLADRLDSLMGLFAVGLAPTGTKDPYAQRRAALGICQNLIAWEMPFDLQQGLDEAREVMTVDVSDENAAACLEFIQGRLRVMLLDMGFNYDVVDAVLAEKGNDPYGTLVGIRQLADIVAREDWSEILPAFSRCVRITRDLDEVYAVDEACLEEKAEKDLLKALEKAESDLAGADTVDAFIGAFVPMVPAINTFFDAVLVMAEDENVRQTRLGLLQRVAALSDGIADLSFLEGF
jgi:glycyl-tRNA synthetase